ncbi:MAG: response regulator transcription factor [Anaerolineae bacterium]
MTTDKIRILIADDHPVVRQGLSNMLLNLPEVEVVGEACDATQALERVASLKPDLILLDVRMPGRSGLQILPFLRKAHPDIKVIVLTSYDSDEYLFGSLRSGAHAFLLKSIAHEKLADAIRQVYHGERQLTPDLVGRVLEEFEAQAQEVVRYETGLTDSELEILRLIAEGYSNREIASQEHWSEVTIKRKVADIFRKLNVTSRSQAIMEAVKRGLI